MFELWIATWCMGVQAVGSGHCTDRDFSLFKSSASAIYAMDEYEKEEYWLYPLKQCAFSEEYHITVDRKPRKEIRKSGGN